MKRTREHQLHFYMNDKEYNRMLERMKANNVRNMGEFLRRMATEGYCLWLDLPALQKVTTLLSRCSNNLNQYARKANQTGSIYEADILDLRQRLDGIRDCMEKILTELMALQK